MNGLRPATCWTAGNDPRGDESREPETGRQNVGGRIATVPSPRGLVWRERRGLLASGPRSPSRFPSGFVSGVGSARYSGGAAPDLHRLPKISVRVKRLWTAHIIVGWPKAAQAADNERSRDPE